MKIPADYLLSDALEDITMTITVTRNMWTHLRVRVGTRIMALGARVAGLNVEIQTGGKET